MESDEEEVSSVAMETDHTGRRNTRKRKRKTSTKEKQRKKRREREREVETDNKTREDDKQGRQCLLLSGQKSTPRVNTIWTLLLGWGGGGEDG